MLSEAVRVKFTKVGSLQFISHLDLNRTMKSVMIRAGIPIRYSAVRLQMPGFQSCLQLPSPNRSDSGF